ncbi:hypothetical protein FJ546_05995 [Mesorhizobium sp. B2-4-19]|nr:hypothetical protein FJ546_05995 [Mesorhizobium sp. B2-4-19]
MVPLKRHPYEPHVCVASNVSSHSFDAFPSGGFNLHNWPGLTVRPRLITNPSVFDSSQNRGVLIPVCSRSESETFRESWVISRRAEVCQQSGPGLTVRPFLLSI